MLQQFLKKIGIHSIIYGIGNMSYAIPGFILIPLYTRYLVPSEYGIYSLLTMFFGILLYVYELGMVGALSRQFYEHDDDEKRKRVISTAFFFSLIYCLVLTGLLCVFRNGISRLLFKTPAYDYIVTLGLAAIFFQALIFIPQTVIRLREKPMLYVAMVCVYIGLLIFFTILFLVILKTGLPGIYQALLWTSAISFAAYIAFTIKNYTFKFSFTELKHLLYLGFAFFPALLFSWVIESSDRFILNMLTNLSDVGIYSLGYKVGQVPMLLVRSFNLAWLPIMFSVVKTENAERMFGKIATYFVLIISVFIFALSLFSGELIRVLATIEYAGAHRIIFLIALSHLFYGLYVFFLTGMIIKKKLYSLPIVLFAGAALNIGLNFVLIPRYNIMGAAAATLVSYMLVAFLAYYFAQRSYRISYETRKMAKIILSGIIVYFVSTLVRIENLYLSIGIRTVFLCAYIAILYALGVIKNQDILKLKKIFVNSSKDKQKLD